MGGMQKKRDCRASRVIMGGCRHSLPSVEELRTSTAQTRREIDLMGAFGAENRGLLLKNLAVSEFVHGGVPVVN